MLPYQSEIVLLVAEDSFHPDLRTVARWLPRGAISPRTLRPIRMGSRLLAKIPKRGVEVHAVGSVSIRLHGPMSSDRPLPALLWIHGGGYVMGSASQDDSICRHFAQSLGIMVVAVEYRLAPENQFPVPLHDCHDALLWLKQHPHVDPTRIAVGGASSGGGLAAALALLARDRGQVELAFQLLAYPMLDDRTAFRTDLDESEIQTLEQSSEYVRLAVLYGPPTGIGRSQ